MTDSSAARPAHGSTAGRNFPSHARVAAGVCETARLFHSGGQPEHGRPRGRDSDIRSQEADRPGRGGASVAGVTECPQPGRRPAAARARAGPPPKAARGCGPGGARAPGAAGRAPRPRTGTRHGLPLLAHAPRSLAGMAGQGRAAAGGTVRARSRRRNRDARELRARAPRGALERARGVLAVGPRGLTGATSLRSFYVLAASWATGGGAAVAARRSLN